MFKNMGLAKKIALGLGVLIIIAGVLGTASWDSLRRMSANMALEQKGTACLGKLNACAGFRRDFALRGFEKPDGDSQNAAEKWKDAATEMTEQLRGLQRESKLDDRGRALVATALEKADTCGAAFDKQVAARQAHDEAFEAWRQIGGNVTKDVENAVRTVIEPAVAAALKSEKPEEIARWTQVSDRLDKEVVQRFLLLRVSAVYLLATNQDAQWVAYQEQLKKTREGLEAWSQVVREESQLQAVATSIQNYLQSYEAAGVKYHDSILASRAAEVEMGTVASGIVDSVNQLSGQLRQEMGAITTRANLLSMTMTLGAIILGVILAVFITRSIVKPINRIILGLNEGADQVTDAAGQVASASQQLAGGASEQASSLEETSSALEEMVAMTRTNAENATQANELSGRAKVAAQNGDKTMEQLNVSMSGINESSNQISKIIKVIEEIAFQTNLLALNAAVEAARAGEHGKGFAVVAEEVRNLAQRAAQASREITGLIEDSVGKARQGTTVAEGVGKSLAGIIGDVTLVADLVNGIARASHEHAQGVDQISSAVSQMDKVTQQNAAGAEESASAAEEMAAQAATVKAIVQELAVVIGQRGDVGRSAPSAVQAKPRAKAAASHEGQGGKALRHARAQVRDADGSAASSQDDEANLEQF